MCVVLSSNAASMALAGALLRWYLSTGEVRTVPSHCTPLALARVLC